MPVYWLNIPKPAKNILWQRSQFIRNQLISVNLKDYHGNPHWLAKTTCCSGNLVFKLQCHSSPKNHNLFPFLYQNYFHLFFHCQKPEATCHLHLVSHFVKLASSDEAKSGASTQGDKVKQAMTGLNGRRLQLSKVEWLRPGSPAT